MDLLYEIGVEEVPASYIQPALDQLKDAFSKEMADARLTHGPVRTAATPRHFVLAVSDVAERQPDAEEEQLGPSVKVAFDAEGNPTKAALGFARSQGVEPAQLFRKETPRGEYLALKKFIHGRQAVDVLAEILPRITLKLSFPKSMVWASGQPPFARPVRWFVALLGEQVIPFTLFGVESGRVSEGHPILRPGRIELANADYETYRRTLEEYCVIVEGSQRRAKIQEELLAALQPFGGKFREEALLNEVTNLTQYPAVMTGRYEDSFLTIPAPVIEAAMMEHQRYFPVRNAEGRLEPRFLFVSDRGREHEELIRLGNEEVLRARLADARFFDEQDRKVPLDTLTGKLDGVSFLKGLGSYSDKAERLQQLAERVATTAGLPQATMEYARAAARICKADLLTEMVGEFPALQGEVGKIYAQREGHPEAVAIAIEEHYLPRSADGPLPASEAGSVLSLAEKIDNLIGCFAAGLIPSGSQDPYALRRQSQGLIRIIEQTGWRLPLCETFEFALALLPKPHSQSENAVEKLLEFLRDRLVQTALDRGAPHDLIHAALAAGFNDLCDALGRIEVLRRISAEPWWPELVTSVERTHNICKNAPDGITVSAELLSDPHELAVWAKLQENEEEIATLRDQRQYVEAARRYAEVFAAPLHEFFDKVFVNVEDERVRNNRLALMRRVNRLFAGRIADLSQIVTGVQK